MAPVTERFVDVEEIVVSDADLAAVGTPSLTMFNCGPAQTIGCSQSGCRH